MGSRHFVIIGNGISGITFARHLRKGDDQARITVISGESRYFFSRTALMYVYMGQMKWEQTQPYEPDFWKKNRIDLKQAWVKTLDFETKTLVFESGETLNYDRLVLATGSKPAFFGWPGQDLKGVQGLYSKQDLERMEAITSHCQDTFEFSMLSTVEKEFYIRCGWRDFPGSSQILIEGEVTRSADEDEGLMYLSSGSIVLSTSSTILCESRSGDAW